MKIGVIGFGHFAGVISHCLSLRGHDVTASDFTPPLFREDQRLPAHEPGWALNYTIGMDAFPNADLFWIAYDVPLSSAGYPLTEEIFSRVQRLDREVPKTIPFLVSCQWPVGTTRKIAQLCEGREFVYVMENVRAGKAILDFQADPIPIIGLETGFAVADVVERFIAETSHNTQIMFWESAEFGKHAMNAFIALQIAFVNELGRLAPPDVDMADVTRVLKADARVSPHAPLTAGAPFGGGSLKRDLMVLYELTPSAYTPIIGAVLPSNEWTPDAEEARAERKARRQ